MTTNSNCNCADPKATHSMVESGVRYFCQYQGQPIEEVEKEKFDQTPEDCRFKLYDHPASEVKPGFAIVPINVTRAMQAVFRQDDWEWRDVLVAAESITEEEYGAAITQATSDKPEPDWYHAECTDPDRSGFHRAKADAHTQVNDHGGHVTELFAEKAPTHPLEARALTSPQLEEAVAWPLKNYDTREELAYGAGGAAVRAFCAANGIVLKTGITYGT